MKRLKIATLDKGWCDKDEILPVSYTHLRAHETVLDLVCRLLLEKKKPQNISTHYSHYHKKKHNT